MKLFYGLLGYGRSAISSIRIRGDEVVEDVLNKIATAVGMNHLDISLYLAKQNGDKNGRWLEEGGDELDALFQIDFDSQCLERYTELNMTCKVSEYFADVLQGICQKYAVHVLVVAWPRTTIASVIPTVGIPRSSYQAQLVDTNSASWKRRQPSATQWTPESTPFPQLVFDDADKILRIPTHYLVNSGIDWPQRDSDMLLYRRAPLVDEWNKIQDGMRDTTTSTRLWIVGAPGSGKSSAAYAFACGQVDRTQWDVVWIHFCRDYLSLSCVMFQDDVKSWSVIRFRKFETSRAAAVELEGLLNVSGRSKNAIVFYDGYNKQCTEAEDVRLVLYHWEIEDPQCRRLVCVNSMVSSPIPSSSVPPRSNRRLDSSVPSIAIETKSFRLVSWTLDECIDAIRHDSFYHQVQRNLESASADRGNPRTTRALRKNREDQVREKYFVAGGSARFMFTTSTQDCIETLQYAMGPVGNIASFWRGCVGDASSEVVSTLLAQYFDPVSEDYEHRLLSSYVARLFAKRLSPDAILRLAWSLGVDPSVDSHLLEAWVLSSMQHYGLDYQVRSSRTHTVQTWEPQEMWHLDPKADATSVASRLMQNGWFAPAQWNQGGYDAVLVESCAGGRHEQRRLTFVKITCALTHGFHAKPFEDLLVKLKDARVKLAKIDLVYVVPMERLDKFSVPVNDDGFQKAVINSVFPRNRSIKSGVSVVGVDYRK